MLEIKKQLQLLIELDKARDSLEVEDNPHFMFESILQLLLKHFNAEAGAIMLQTQEGKLESLALAEVGRNKAIELCKEAMKSHEPAPFSITTVWPHTLSLAIIQDESSTPLGGFFLARNSTAFTQDEIALLKFAEAQLDSAVLQARYIWKLANRNLELEAIYQIDRLRDETPAESELISSFTTLLNEYFKAELSMIILTHADSGELIVRGMVTKQHIPVEAINMIRDISGNISIPQIIETPAGLGTMDIMAAPLVTSNVQFGSVVIGRNTPFYAADQRLLFAMISQLDSAIIHCRVIEQLHQRNNELETIYRIDVIRDRESELDTMLQHVLSELCKAVSTELGYLMLFSEDEANNLELKASTVEGILTSPAYYEALTKYSRQALEEGKPIYSNMPDGPVRSIVAIPLILNEQIIGVFGAVNSSNSRGFTDEDRRILSAITSQVDTAVFERLERRQMRRVLSRSVDPKVIDHLLSRTDENILGGERIVLTMLFADLRGSTAWAERTAPEELVSTLNRFLAKMTDVIFEYGGTLDKFVGDEVIAIFGSPAPMNNHELTALRCGIKMQKEHKILQEELKAQSIELPSMGIGISTGEVIAGEIGSAVRSDFTALGRYMNLGARLCSAAGAQQIYISDNTRNAALNFIETKSLASLQLKGLNDVVAYELLQVKEELIQDDDE